jgi:hypothetical protein
VNEMQGILSKNDVFAKQQGIYIKKELSSIVDFV